MVTSLGGFRSRALAATALLWTCVSTPGAIRADEPVDLGALLAEAESNHPELARLAARRAAAAEVPSQREALPDPTLSVAYTNEGFDSFTLGSSPDANLTFAWTQELPYPGKRRLASEVARGELTTAELEIESARVRIRTEVERLYFELYRIDRTNELLAETRGVLTSLVGAARARYESGEGALEDVLKAQTELTAIEVDLAMNREDRRATEAMLAAAVGRSAGASFGPATELPPIVPPERAAIEARAVASSPEIRVLEAMVETEARRVEFARRNLKPDLMYGASYAERGGLDSMIMGMFGVRLPLYRGRKQAAELAETGHALEAARRDVERERNEILARVRGQFARFERATSLAPLYSTGLIPQARSTLDAATGAYAAGTTDFLALLDDALKVLRYEIDYERERVEARLALVGLEELAGAELILPSTGGFNE